MKIAFGSDDRNEAVEAVSDYLSQVGTVDVIAPSDRWSEIARDVGEAVARGDAELGVVMCWTGTGSAIAANKVRGIRAALAWDAWIAEGARRWNDANVLALSLKRTAPDVAVECVKAFLSVSDPDPDEAESIAVLAGK